MGSPKKKITLLWGLPGSGKTTEAWKIAGITGRNLLQTIQRSKEGCIIDLDYIGRDHKGDAFFKKVVQEVSDAFFSSMRMPHVVLDGLITTNEDADKLLSKIKEDLTEAKTSPEIVIVWWKKDIEACLHNDKGRRKIASETTIKNIPFEEPSKELLEKFGAKAERRTVWMKPVFDVWMDENQFDKGTGYLKSSSWSLGGTSGSYTGRIYGVSAEPQPASFADFDDLLLKICPELSFLKYKKLYNETVTIETGGESDYYGGSTSHAWYQCDLKKLYDMLNEWGLIGEATNGMEPQLPRGK
jgi:hypothetical protein